MSTPQAAGERVSDGPITHIGGPTVLIEVGGWRLLTDPTFDAPGRSYRFGWGTGSRKTAGPAIAPEALGRIDAVLLTPRPPRRQPRPGGPRAAAVGRRRDHHRVGRAPARRRRAGWPTGRRRRSRARGAADRGHRDAPAATGRRSRTRWSAT